MDAFSLLQRDLQHYIYQQGWSALTKIQAAAIKYVHQTSDNLILAAPTAAGKTEAAFLPAINAVSDWQHGIKILYVSPLVALINDQFARISQLCRALEIPVNRWHGEVSRTSKVKLLQDPRGILLITPESLEALLDLHPEDCSVLFASLEWALVDEIHSFLGNNRGIQLQSLLERLQHYTQQNPRYLGMSATITKTDSTALKQMFANDRPTKILLDRGQNQLAVTVDYFAEDLDHNAPEALTRIYQLSQKETMLVFPNSRRNVEYLASNLQQLGSEYHSPVKYFTHHAALTKADRSRIEHFAKGARQSLFTICATSTLELGIDIGAVDSVVQYNAPYSVASLAQRLGRSGRQTKKSQLHFIATEPWSLLQGLATIQLYQRGALDAATVISKPYDVFAHQLLALLLERNGIDLVEFKRLPRLFKAWSWISDVEFLELTEYLLEEGYLERLGPEMICGTNAEKLMHGADFFAQFATAQNFAVVAGDKKVGELPLTNELEPGSSFILNAKAWVVTRVIVPTHKIYVEPTVAADVMDFGSGGGEVSQLMRQEMLSLLEAGPGLKVGPDAANILADLKAEVLAENGSPFVTDENNLRTFCGTKINRTLQLMFSSLLDRQISFTDKTTTFHLPEEIDVAKLLQAVLNISWEPGNLRGYLAGHPHVVARLMAENKYQVLLPQTLKIEYVLANLVDLPLAYQALQTIAERI